MPYRIFLVEDHPVVRQGIADVLAREDDLALGGTVLSAEAALETLDPAAWDLVLTDLSLPGMGGDALAERLADLRPGLPVVVLSVRDDAPFRQRALASGARAFLSKWSAATTLVPTLRAILSGSPAAGDALPPAPRGEA